MVQSEVMQPKNIFFTQSVPQFCFMASPLDPQSCVGWLADPCMGGWWFHQRDLCQQPRTHSVTSCGVRGASPVSHLLALPLLGSSQAAGLEGGCTGFPHLVLLGKPQWCWIPASVKTEVAVEVMVLKEETEQVHDSPWGWRMPGRRDELPWCIVYRGTVLIYHLCHVVWLCFRSFSFF